MSYSGPPPDDAAGRLSSSRAPEQPAERIGAPASRLEFRSRATFNAQAWWGVLLIAVAAIFIATALGFQHVYNENTTIVFGEVTKQADMAWYYDHPWLGALVLAGLPALAFAWLIINVLEARFAANALRTEVADLSLQLQHTGYRLQAQLDQLATRLEQRDLTP